MYCIDNFMIDNYVGKQETEVRWGCFVRKIEHNGLHSIENSISLCLDPLVCNMIKLLIC